MTTVATVKSGLPPGKTGLPYLGEALAFSKNPYAFIETRQKQYGSIFRSKILGQNTIVMVGAEAWEVFSKPDNVGRENALLPFLRGFFGGPIIELVDGAPHRRLRHYVQQALTHESMTIYLPAMQQLVETALQDWSRQGEYAIIDDLKQLAIQIICTNIAGIEPGPRQEKLLKYYNELLPGPTALPLKLPGTPYSKALKAVDSILAILAEVVSEHRRNPTSDGLSQLLAATDERGESISDEQATLELHHLVLAGLIVFGVFAEILIQLNRYPEVKDRLQEEIRRVAPSGALSLEQLANMPFLLQVVMEAKRHAPVLANVFGRARRTFEFKGYTIPKNSLVLMALRASNLDSQVYTIPENFDPDRFSPERAEQHRHQYAFVPQSAGVHQCLGIDYSTLFVQVFTVALLRGYSWELPPQNLDMIYTKIVPEPKDGLRIQLKPVNTI